MNLDGRGNSTIGNGNWVKLVTDSRVTLMTEQGMYEIPSRTMGRVPDYRLADRVVTVRHVETVSLSQAVLETVAKQMQPRKR